jgi:catechol 2,3-dioxygenase-like lactoylglutathione lyase family enzyme
MPVALNHTIVHARDPQASAAFLADILGRPAPARFAHFHVVELDNGVSLDYLQTDEVILREHYAFLVGEAEFDAIFGRMTERHLPYWADPGHQRAGRINRRDGGRGIYWDDPDGHVLEILTRPYGSGS